MFVLRGLGDSLGATTSNIVATPMTFDQAKKNAQTISNLYYEREGALAKALALTLNSTCPPTSVKNGYCYNGNVTTPARAVPGGFEVFGVPFNITEVGLSKSPKFTRTYTPNNEQRVMAEFQVINRSKQMLDGALIKALEANYKAKYKVPPPLGAVAKLHKELSVNAALALLPRWKTGPLNMSMRSIDPTTSELKDKGGYNKWIGRGGFLIALDVIQSKVAATDFTVCPQVCTSILCKCASTQFPSCIWSGIPTSNSNNLGGCFYTYISIYQGPPWYFEMSLVHDDPNWLQKLGAKLESFMTSFANVFCQAAPVVQGQMTSIVQPKCIDKDGKTCKQGTTGCNCTTPSAAAKGGVGLFNFGMNSWCAGWNAEQAPDPSTAIPPTPDPPPYIPPPPTWQSLLPWTIGGLAIGAIAFSRKR